MKKPGGIVTVLIMNSINLVFTLFPMGIFTAVAMLPEGNEYKRIAEAALGTSLNARILGEIFGSTMLPLVAIVALYGTVAGRKYTLTIVILIVQLLLALSDPLKLIMTFVMLLVTIISKKSKMYLKNEQINKPINELGNTDIRAQE